MRYRLTEVFGEQHTYWAGISFETVTYDQDQNTRVTRKGWEVPYMEADVGEIDAYASKYQIPGRRDEDARTSTWEGEEPFKDGMTGDETYYILHVKNIDHVKADHIPHLVFQLEAIAFRIKITL